MLLFPTIGVLGVAWLRIASAAAAFAPWTKPWRTIANADRRTRLLLVALGACLAVMNTAFYLALDRLPMSLVAAIEFVGTIGVALYGLRTARNLVALLVAVLGVFILIDVKWSSDPLGLFWAVLNGALFVGYIILGHKISESGASGGVNQLGAAMAIAFIFVMPIGFAEAVKAFGSIELILAGIGVGICSSVIPYICDQLAMSRLPARKLRPPVGIAACNSDHHRCARAGSGSNCSGHHRRDDGHGRRCDPQACLAGSLTMPHVSAAARLADALDVPMIRPAAAAEHIDLWCLPRRSRYWPPSSIGSPASRSGASLSS